MTSPSSTGEAQRLSALRRLDLLDAPAEEAFDRLARLTARVLDAPATFISLVDAEREFHLSVHGPAAMIDPADGGLADALCRRVVESGDTVVIPDTAHDVLPGDAPIASGEISACLGAPLRLPGGEVVGALCAVDTTARAWSEREVSVMEELAGAVVTEIELREARRQAEAERGGFRDLIEDLDAIVWEMDVETWTFTFASQNVERILGYPARDWLDLPCFWQDRIVHPADREWAVDFCTRATAELRDHEFDYRAVAADGSVVWLHDRVRVVPGQDGEPRLLRGVMVDITDRKVANEALHETEAKFREIAENVREIFWIFDPDFTETIYVSPSYEEIWGLSVEELYRRTSSFVDPVHPDDVEGLLKGMRRVKDEPVEGVEFRIIQPDGSVRWAEARGFPVRDADGNTYRVAGTTEDITARKEAQAKLAAAEAHYRRLVKNAPYAIYALDADGCFIELNPAGERLLELEPGEAIGRHFSTVIAPSDIELATSAFDDVLAGEADDLEFEEWIRRPSGDERLIRVTESAIRDGDRITGTHGIARDITGEAERERQLRRTERLASIGTLVGGVAHELNNPLHTIMNFATLLADGGGTAEARDDLETIQREAMRAARIVSDLRLLARNTQDDDVDRSPVDMNDVVRYVLKTRGAALDRAGIEVREDLTTPLPPILGDRGRIEQVVLNLIGNAEQAMEERSGGRLIVRTSASNDDVVLHIEDTGPGIRQEHLDHIFDPFFTTKAPGSGTGLGLTLVHTILTDHGGTVDAASDEGEGTVFRIALPAAAPTGAESASPAVAAAESRTLRILVVDDEPAIRDALSRYLQRRRGHTVDVAADGREALRCIEDEGARYDVILSDLRMPGLGGHELLTRLRESGTDLEQRLIFLTGDAASGHAARVLEEANAPVIFKPIDLADLADHVERHARELDARSESRTRSSDTPPQ